MRSLISFKVVQFYIHLFTWALFCTENLRVSGKQRQRNSTALRIVKDVTFLWIATRRLWGTIRFDIRLLETSEGLGGGRGVAMEFPWAWNIFKNFLINLYKGEWFWRALIFFENSVSPLRLSQLRLGSYKS